ncbi:MAG: YceI family protein [Parvularculaceae bacterium]
MTAKRLLMAATAMLAAACGGAANDRATAASDAQQATASPSSDAGALPSAAYALVGDASRLSFVSIKAGDVIETHRFDGLSGGVSADGVGRLVVDLASVNTGIDIRNERMREVFFEIANFPEATIETEIDAAAFKDLSVGERRPVDIDGALTLHGVEAPIVAEAFITRLSETRVAVDSAAPVPVDAAAFDLGDGVEALRELAGLPSITPASLVTFSLVYDAGE